MPTGDDQVRLVVLEAYDAEVLVIARGRSRLNGRRRRWRERRFLVVLCSTSVYYAEKVGRDLFGHVFHSCWGEPEFI